MVGLACCGGTCVPCWGGTLVRFSWGGLASKLGLHAMLGQHWSSVTASLAHHDRVVAVDLHVAKGGGGGHDLCVGGVVERQGFDDPACGVKRVSVTLVRKGMKKKK